MPAVALNNGPANGEDVDQAPALLVPFTRASNRFAEPFGPTITRNLAAATNVGLEDVVSYGYLRRVRVTVTAAGGAAGMATVAANADAPWNALSEGVLQDVNANPIVGPLAGYNLYLANLVGAILGTPHDPADDPDFSDVDADGNFSFSLYLPAEFVPRQALGALPNMDSSQTYKLRLSQAGSADVYDTPPDTLPTVTYTFQLESWSPPAGTDLMGNRQQTEPDAVGTTSWWSNQVITDVSSGENTLRFRRVGNMIRLLTVVWRQSGSRTESDLPSSYRFEYDTQPVWLKTDDQLTQEFRVAYGFDPPTGVRVIHQGTTDFDGLAGGELRDYYLRTTGATRLDLRATFGGAGTLDVLTNDISPAGNIFDAAV